MKPLKVIQNKNLKILSSEDYNMRFRYSDGYMSRWGKTEDDDPLFCPYGPEILDIEITKNGCPDNCPYCYKANSNDAPTNMSFEQFKHIIDLMPPPLTQVALGITGLQSNPDMFKMMEYCKSKNVTPNLTTTGYDMTDEIAKKLSELCGAVAVSIKEHDPELGYSTVKRLTDLGMKQINIHLVLYKESLPHIRRVLFDIKADERLAKLNAVVFLSLKKKGRAMQGFSPVGISDLKSLVIYCKDTNMNFGMDSCTAWKFIQVVKELQQEGVYTKEQVDEMIKCVDPCESSLFSGYINEKGEWWNCSFCEHVEDVSPVNLLNVTNFLNEVWYSEPVKDFRNNVLKAHSICKSCWKYDI